MTSVKPRNMSYKNSKKKKRRLIDTRDQMKEVKKEFIEMRAQLVEIIIIEKLTETDDLHTFKLV